MQVVDCINEVKKIIRDAKKAGKTVGFVPTMGFLHEGHLSLMKAAKSKCDLVVVSIFVNPIQFGPNEDFDQYPRDLYRDYERVRSMGVDLVFTPQVGEMYPEKFNTQVQVHGVTDKLCGKSRPGHFTGVATVVNKFLNIVQPDYAFFGQKDAQQVVVISKMVEELNMNVIIEMVPIVREADGLAMSSRNTFLDEEQRQGATILYKSLQYAKRIIENGEKDVNTIKQAVEKMISTEPLAHLDYVEVLSFPELETIDHVEGRLLIALAVFVGKTRLIDNTIWEG